MSSCPHLAQIPNTEYRRKSEKAKKLREKRKRKATRERWKDNK
jgi:hypothetical protein